MGMGSCKRWAATSCGSARALLQKVCGLQGRVRKSEALPQRAGRRGGKAVGSKRVACAAFQPSPLLQPAGEQSDFSAPHRMHSPSCQGFYLS